MKCRVVLLVAEKNGNFREWIYSKDNQSKSALLIINSMYFFVGVTNLQMKEPEKRLNGLESAYTIN